MTLRDKIFLLVGAIFGVGGIILTFLFGTEIGIIALLLLGVFIVFLLLLQRRQTAKIQTRLIQLLRATNANERVIVPEAPSVPVKHIMGILQAQQISMERLPDEVTRALQEYSQR